MPLMSFVRWISNTSGLSFRFLPNPFSVLRVRLSASLRSFASGCAERLSSPSISISSSEDASSSAEDPSFSEIFLLFLEGLLVAGVAHSGVGYNLSNCLRNLRAYSFPLIKSSFSVFRNFRSRGTEVKDTTMRSSSLSSQAGASRPASTKSSSESSAPGAGTRALPAIASGPASTKKSWDSVSKLEGGVHWPPTDLHRHPRHFPIRLLHPLALRLQGPAHHRARKSLCLV